MPISQPRPNWPPSVKRVEALTYTAALSVCSAKRRGGFGIGGNDGVGMAGAVRVDVGDGFVGRADNLDGEDVVGKLGVEVFRPRRRAADEGGGSIVGAQLYRRQSPRLSVFNQTPAQTRQEGGGDVAVDQAHFGGVAHRRAAGLALSVMSKAIAKSASLST